MKQRFITLLIGIMAVFAFMPMSVSAAVVCRTTSGPDIAYTCGQVVLYPCTFEGLDASGGTTLSCSTRHGLIIGAHGVTINGDGYTLDGLGTAARTCTVAIDPNAPPQPLGQPCRVDSNGDGLSSGIFNAITSTSGDGSGCVVGAPVGQGGCDNLTVKNLEITGWCDGIFVSGTSNKAHVFDLNDPDPNKFDYVKSQDLIEGLKIDHNVIHHNGKDCPTCYNDGIFTALLGVADSGYPTLLPINDPGEYTCTPENESIISNNNIWNQKGNGVEAGPGGNGINLQGGWEFDIIYPNDPNYPDYPDGANPIRYSSCVEVHNNAIMQTRLSGIMLTHALEGVEMYKNDIEYAEYGGITIPCDFVKFNTIEHNVIIKCAGVGIGVFDGTHITGNVVKDTVKGMERFDAMGFPNAGDGILVNAGGAGKVGNTSDLQDNISCFSYDKDIKVVGGSAVACGANQCCKTNTAADPCHRWNCAGFLPSDNCNDPGFGADGWSVWKQTLTADINNDGTVFVGDSAVMYKVPEVWLKSFTNEW